MPQLDISTFSTQLFWLVVIFFCFYSFSFLYAVPGLSRVLKVRNKKNNSKGLGVGFLYAVAGDFCQEYNYLFNACATKSSLVTSRAVEGAGFSSSALQKSVATKSNRKVALYSSKVSFQRFLILRFFF